MKTILKNLLIFIIVTLIIFFTFTTKKFIDLCNEYQIQIFCTNGSGSIDPEKKENLYPFKLRSLGAAIINMSELSETDSTDQYDTNGYALWAEMQIAVYEITQYWLLSIFLGIAITFGYNIALSKKMNKVLKIIVGYILPIIVMPTLYYLIRNSREIFVEQNKLIYFGIIYTVVFIAINITNYVINKNSIKEK
jgi:hypothetical protein